MREVFPIIPSREGTIGLLAAGLLNNPHNRGIISITRNTTTTTYYYFFQRNIIKNNTTTTLLTRRSIPKSTTTTTTISSEEASPLKKHHQTHHYHYYFLFLGSITCEQASPSTPLPLLSSITTTTITIPHLSRPQAQSRCRCGTSSPRHQRHGDAHGRPWSALPRTHPDYGSPTRVHHATGKPSHHHTTII